MRHVEQLSYDDCREIPRQLRNHADMKLVELPESLNHRLQDGVRIFTNGGMWPLGNIKSLPAGYMLWKAKQREKLQGVHVLVEASSGNMAFCLSVLAPRFGIHALTAVVPPGIALQKERMLRMLGVEVVKHKGDTIQLAREMGSQPGYLNLRQYANDDNVAAYEEVLAPALFRQLHFSVFAGAVGTSGTVRGFGRYLHRQINLGIQVVGVHLVDGESVPGMRDLPHLQSVELFLKRGSHGIDDINQHVQVTAKTAYETSLKMCRQGILGGPSSGAALVGTHLYLAQVNLDALRDHRGEVKVLFLCPDTPLPYEYPSSLAV